MRREIRRAHPVRRPEWAPSAAVLAVLMLLPTIAAARGPGEATASTAERAAAKPGFLRQTRRNLTAFAERAGGWVGKQRQRFAEQRQRLTNARQRLNDYANRRLIEMHSQVMQSKAELQTNANSGGWLSRAFRKGGAVIAAGGLGIAGWGYAQTKAGTPPAAPGAGVAQQLLTDGPGKIFLGGMITLLGTTMMVKAGNLQDRGL